MIYLPARFFLWTIPFGFDKMESEYNGGLIYGSVGMDVDPEYRIITQ